MKERQKRTGKYRERQAISRAKVSLGKEMERMFRAGKQYGEFKEINSGR